MKHKWIIISAILVLIALVGFWMVRHFQNAQIDRRVSIIEGKGLLKSAYKDYLANGYVTNYNNSNYQIWLPTNMIVTVGTTQYECFIATQVGEIKGDSVLAMTTNQVFILLDGKQAPQIVENN